MNKFIARGILLLMILAVVIGIVYVFNLFGLFAVVILSGFVTVYLQQKKLEKMIRKLDEKVNVLK